MSDFESLFTKLSYHLSDLGTLTLYPFSENGILFLSVQESGRKFGFECIFKDVMKHVMETDGETLWPDMDPLSAKMSLFSVHVEEAVSLAPDGAYLLAWGAKGLEARSGILPQSMTTVKKSHEKGQPLQ